MWRLADTEQPMPVPLDSPSLEIGWLHPDCLLGIVLASANFQTVPGSYSVVYQAAWAKTMPDTSLLIKQHRKICPSVQEHSLILLNLVIEPGKFSKTLQF